MPAVSADMETPQDNPSRWRGLGLRIAGAVPLLIVTLLAVVQGGFLFYTLMLLATVIMLREWDNLVQNEGTFLRLLPYPLTIIPCASVIWLRMLALPSDAAYGTKLLLLLIAIIAATDTGAYFTGKRFGKFKLAPTISPNKTWEGLSGGVLCAMLASAFLMPLPLTLWSRLGLGMTLALLAQTGDILESWVKRRRGVKDSGTLIPGHGGLLDRVDGYLLSAPFFALFVHAL